MEIEAENTNNEDQILIKVISLKTHVVTDCGAVLHQVFWSGTTFKKVINKYRRYLSPKYKIFQIVFDRYKKKKKIARITKMYDVKYATHHVPMF